MKEPIKLEGLSAKPRPRVMQTERHLADDRRFDEPTVALLTDSEKVYILEDDQFHVQDGNGNFMDISDAQPGEIFYVPCIVNDSEATSPTNSQRATNTKQPHGQIDFDLD